MWPLRRKPPKPQRSNVLAVQRQTEAGEETVMGAREGGRQKRRTEEGIPDSQGPERGGGHIQPQNALSPIPLTGLGGRDSGLIHDPKTEGDPGLVPAPAAESIQGRRSINGGAKREMMAERETVREAECPRIRDVVGLDRDPDPDLDQRTINVVDLLPGHGPDPGKGGKNTRLHNNPLSPPETRLIHNQKIRGNTGRGRAQEKGEKTKDYPKIHRKLQGPVLYHLKTQNCYRTGKKRRISFKALSKRKRWPK